MSGEAAVGGNPTPATNPRSPRQTPEPHSRPAEGPPGRRHHLLKRCVCLDSWPRTLALPRRPHSQPKIFARSSRPERQKPAPPHTLNTTPAHCPRTSAQPAARSAATGGPGPTLATACTNTGHRISPDLDPGHGMHLDRARTVDKAGDSAITPMPRSSGALQHPVP